MKILWIDDSLVDESLHLTSRIEMAKALKNLNNEVELVLLYHKNKFFPSYERTTIYKYNPGNVFSALALQLRTVLKLVKSKCEVIICSSVFVWACVFYKFVINMTAGKKKGFVLDIRSIPVETEGVKKRLGEIKFSYSVKLASKCFDGVTTITEDTKLELTKSYGINFNSSFVWCSGVNLEHFNPSRIKPNTIKKTLGLEDKFIVMYHGALSANRGIQNVIRSVSLIKDSVNNIFLLLIGAGEGRKEFEGLIRHLYLENNCKIIPSVSYSEIPEYINVADIGILPFPDIRWWRVSSPLKLMEYLSMAKCVILTDIRAHRNVVDNSPCAFFIGDNHPETIANCIRKVANLDKEGLGNRGKYGRNIITEKFAWDNIAKGLDRYIKDIKG